MKKLYIFLVAALAALSANAQTFQYFIGGKEVAPGSRVDITSYIDGVKIDPDLEIKSDQGGFLSATVTNVSAECTPEFDEEEWLTGAKLALQWCAFGDACKIIPVGESLTKTTTLTAGELTKMVVDYGFELGDEQDFSEVTYKGECTVKCSLGGKDYELTLYVDSSNAHVGDIMIDNNAPIEYFDLQGRRIANPSQGLYIVRQGNKVTKSIIK